MRDVAHLERLLAAFFDARFAASLARSGIEVTGPARDLFIRTALAQVEAGIVPAERLMAAIHKLDLDGLPDFYLMKFGPLPLSYNRMVRLLADMHDKWIDRRHAAAEIPGTSCGKAPGGVPLAGDGQPR